MHALTRRTRSIRRWFATMIVAGTAAGIAAAQTTQPPSAAPKPPAAQPAPMGEPASKSAAVATGEKRIKFEFQNKPWNQVFEWLSDQTGLPFASNIKPTGSFTFIAPKGSVGATQGYTIPEIIDILNEVLLQQKFIIIRREATFMVLPADEKIDPTLVPRVAIDELKGRGNTEIISTVLQLNTLVAEDVQPEVKRQLGPFGEVTTLAKSNQLLIQDTVKSIKNVVKTIDDIEKNEKGQSDSFSHVCEWIKARDAERMLKDLMGDPKLLIQERMMQTIPQRDPRDGRPLPPAQPAQKVRIFYFAADERTNSILVSGPPDKIAQARDIIKKIDVPQPGVPRIATPGAPVLKTFTVPAGSAPDVANMLKLQVYKDSKVVQVTASGPNQIMVYAPPAELLEIAGLLNSGGGSGVVVELLNVFTQDAASLASTLKGMFPTDSKTGVGPWIEGDTTRNAINVRGTADQVADIKMALKALDGTGGGGSGNMRIITLDHGSAAQMADFIKQALGERGVPVKVVAPSTAPPKAPATDAPSSPPPGSGNGGGDTPQLQDPQANRQQPPPAGKPVTITAVGNKLIVNTDDPQTMQFIQEIIRTMTQSSGDGDFEVIRLNNANATDAARVIDEFFNGKQQQSQRGGGGDMMSPFGMFSSRGMPGMPQPAAPTTTTSSSKVRVVADPGSNSLFVRGTPIELLTVRQLVKSLEGEEATQAAQKSHFITFKHAIASEVAQVIESVYHDYLGTDSQRGSFGGYPGFGFGGMSSMMMGGMSSGMSSRSSRGSSRGGSMLGGGTDANGNPRPHPLAIGVDERSNSLIVMSNESLFNQIKTLTDELEKQAAGAVRTVKVVSIKGMDPALVEQAIQAFQGNRSTQQSGGSRQSGMGGSPFGGSSRSSGMGGSPYGGSPYGGSSYGSPYSGRSSYGGSPYGGSSYGGSPYGGSSYGGSPFGGMGGPGGSSYGGGPGGSSRYGGGSSRYGGGPPQRSPDREPGGPDFFEHGVKEDPQPLQQLFDPRQQLVARANDPRLSGTEEQQQPPAPPAGQPTPPATQPGQPPVGPGSVPQPRRPVGVEALEDLGVVVISGDNQDDVEAIVKIIEMIGKFSPGFEAKIDLVPLEKADATSVANILTQIYQRINATPSGNILIGAQAGRQGVSTTAISTGGSALFLALPRFNSILVVAQEARLKDIRGEIAKLDQPNSPAGRATAFPLRKAAAAQIATLLTQFYAQRYPQENNTQNQVRITSDNSTNTVFVQAGPADMDEIRQLIERLDSSHSSAVNDLRIVRVNNALADELANTIIAAITAGIVPGTTAAPGIVPTPGAIGRPATTTTAGGGGLTTKTVSLRFFTNQPGPGSVVDAGALEDAHITSDIRSNSLIIAAPSRTMDLILALVKSLDVVAAAQSSINIFTLRKADAVQTAQLLQQLFLGTGTTGATTGGGGGGLTAGAGPGGTLGFAATTGAAPAGGLARPLINMGAGMADGSSLVDLRVGVDNRTNTILVAGSRSDLDVIEAIINRLEDANTPTRQSQVYRLRNATAADVANALQTFVTNSLAVLQTANQVTAFQEIQRAVVIVPEAISNTLLISATPQYFAELYRLIEQLDSMPPQVVIQVLVAEVTLNDDQEFGVEFGLQSPVLFNRGILPATQVTSAQLNAAVPGFNFNSTNPLPNSNIISPPTVGFQGLGTLGVGRSSPTANVGGLVISAQSNSFNLLIRALKTQGRLDVLSRPQVMTLDGQTAAVSVGQDIPIASSTNVTSTGLVTTGIDRRNVGVLLRVTPRITPEGKVLMRVFPEVSSVIPTPVAVAAGVTSTAFNIQQVETSVVAQDGETVIIGGMIQQSDQKVENKVPCLGDLPYLGAAFRYRTQIRKKTELLVILTPHVVRSQSDADRVLTEESSRIAWLLNDVNKVQGPPDLNKLLTTPTLPSVKPPLQAQPAQVGTDSCPPGQLPDGSPLFQGMQGGPLRGLAPQIPSGPLMPLLANDPAVPPPPTAPPPASGPQPTTPPLPPPSAVPTPTDQQQSAGPSLTPASYRIPAQPPQGKESPRWNYRRD
jgi:general secretion pathway protein D